MRKYLLGLLALSMSFSGCSDNESASAFLEYTQGVETSKVLAYDEREFIIPFTAEGEWTARVATDNDAWIRIPVKKGTGSHQLLVILDPNTSDLTRQGEIEITNGVQTLAYSVTQGTLFEANGENANINFAAFGKTQVPLGFAVRIKKKGSGKILPTKMIMDFKQWNELTDEEKKFAKMTSKDYLSQSSVPDTDIDLKTAKDYSQPSQDIKANLKVTIGFGLSKIGLTGGFDLNRTNTDNTYCYQVASPAPHMVYSIDDYDGYMKRATALNPEDITGSSIRDRVLGGEFSEIYDQIVKCFNEDGTIKDPDGLDSALETLNDDFGPVFCHSGTTGGSINLTITAQNQVSDETMKISGKLSIGLNFAFSFDAEASADYLKTAHSTLNQMQVTAKIKGGSTTSHNKLLEATQNVLTQMDKISENTNVLLTAVTDWRKSFVEATEEEDGNTALVEFDLAGIWEVFKHSNSNIQNGMQTAIKAYMREEYPNTITEEKDDKGNITKVETCPYLVNIQEITK